MTTLGKCARAYLDFTLSPSLERFCSFEKRQKQKKIWMYVGEDRERCFRENKTEVFGWARDRKEEKEIFLDFSIEGKNKPKEELE